MSFIPDDVIGKIIDYGAKLSTSKELLLSKINKIDPNHDFRKDYHVKIYRTIALRSSYGHIIEYAYTNGIAIGEINGKLEDFGMRFELTFSEVTVEFYNILIRIFPNIKRNIIYYDCHSRCISPLHELKF